MREEPAIAAKVCTARMSNRTQCVKTCVVGLEVCSRHHKMVLRREENQRAGEVWEEAVTHIWDRNSPADALGAFIAAVEDGRLAWRFVQTFAVAINAEIAAFQGVNAPAPPRTDLEALATDAQNVHTGPVNKQTIEGLELLLETDTPCDANTLKEVEAAWADKHRAARSAVLRDMKRWYRTSFCRTENDRLYERALDGLWVRIQASEHKKELVQRLWEECHESVKMCCDGHLSRLCNVMVGFDAAFKPQVSLGEILQQRMAAIAEEDIDTLLKVEKAWYAMDELAVPMEEREAWIGAF